MQPASVLSSERACTFFHADFLPAVFTPPRTKWQNTWMYQLHLATLPVLPGFEKSEQVLAQDRP